MRRVKRVLADSEYNQVLHGDGASNPFDSGAHHVGVNPLFLPSMPLTTSTAYGEFVLRPAPQHPFYFMVPEGHAGRKSHRYYLNGRRSNHRDEAGANVSGFGVEFVNFLPKNKL